MARWLKLLERAGLVELSPEEAARAAAAAGSAAPRAPSAEELDALLADTADITASLDGGARASGVPAAKGTAPAAPVPEPELFAGRDLSQVYTEAGIPRSPYQAEQLLRVLDGLQAMPPAVRVAAVQAMDAADDAWSLGDPLLDAQRKVKALEGETDRLRATESQAESQAQADLAEQDTYQAQATEQIRAQIAELENLLGTELGQVATERARIQARLEETRHAVAREIARYRDEIARLRSLEQTFPTDTLAPDQE
jgi:hypothetical protein